LNGDFIKSPFKELDRELKYILSLDISKKSTGISILEIKEDHIKLKYIHSIKISKPENYNKLYFLAKDKLIEEIHKIVRNKRLLNKDISVAIEAPVYGAFTSELQVYLTQEVLKLFQRFHINTVLYSPNTLKRFIKDCAYKERIKGLLDKKQIEKVYIDYIYTYNKKKVPKVEALDNDNIDAFFLGLLGSIVQVPYMNHIFDKDMILEIIKFRDFEEAYREIIKEKFFFEEFKRYKIKSYKGLKFGSDEGYSKGFKGLFKNLEKKKHITFGDKLFYWFNTLHIIETALRYFWDEILKDQRRYRVFFRTYFGKVPRNIFDLDVKSIKLGFNKEGKIFFVT
jgi:hypothetical protein